MAPELAVPWIILTTATVTRTTTKLSEHDLKRPPENRAERTSGGLLWRLRRTSLKHFWKRLRSGHTGVLVPLKARILAARHNPYPRKPDNWIRQLERRKLWWDLLHGRNHSLLSCNNVSTPTDAKDGLLNYYRKAETELSSSPQDTGYCQPACPEARKEGMWCALFQTLDPLLSRHSSYPPGREVHTEAKPYRHHPRSSLRESHSIHWPSN